jgi:DNA-binding HxlR family transcriptional regulator
MALKHALSGLCPIERGLAVVGDAWSMLILRDIAAGVRRFDALKVNLGIAGNILAKRLKALVDDGVLERRRYSNHPPRDEYVLTQAGRDFLPVIYAIGGWGRRYNGAGAVDMIVDTETGAEIDPLVVDRTGGQPLAGRRVRFVAAKEPRRAL